MLTPELQDLRDELRPLLEDVIERKEKNHKEWLRRTEHMRRLLEPSLRAMWYAMPPLPTKFPEVFPSAHS